MEFIKRKIVFFIVNHFLAGTICFKAKNQLLSLLGYQIAPSVKIVGPIMCTGKLEIGENTWVGKNFCVNGNGLVTIGSNCDIGPEVIFQTGGHEIGTSEHRAGKGLTFNQSIGNGVWIGGRSTILNNVKIGDGSVIAGCACVIRDVPDNVLVGGVPAHVIKELSVSNEEK